MPEAPVEAGRQETGVRHGILQSPSQASSPSGHGTPHQSQKGRDGVGSAVGSSKHSGMTFGPNQNPLCPRSCPIHQPISASLLFPPKVSVIPYFIHLLNKSLWGICYVCAPSVLGTKNSVMSKYMWFLPLMKLTGVE